MAKYNAHQIWPHLIGTPLMSVMESFEDRVRSLGDLRDGLMLTEVISIPDTSTVTTAFPIEEHKPDGTRESQEKHGMES